MDLGRIRYSIKDRLTPAQNQKGKYICPICGSGTGANRTAAMSIAPDGVHAHCFACGFHGDIFDLTAAAEHISLSEATRRLVRGYGETPERQSSPVRAYTAPKAPGPEERERIRRYVDTCASRMRGSPAEAYLLARGFSGETIFRYRLGYDPNGWAVIPYDREGTYYALRSLEGKRFGKPGTAYAGPEPLFNAGAVKTPVCFVTEAQLDALSVCQCGGHAVAVGGTGIHKLAAYPFGNTVLVLCFDNDEAGKRAAADASALLGQTGTRHTVCNISGACKDPNELLQKDPKALRDNIRKAEKQALGMILGSTGYTPVNDADDPWRGKA